MGRLDPKCATPGCKYIAVVDDTRCVRHGGVPPQRTSGVAPLDHMKLCGATRRDGGTCRQPAMRGQARCYKHGGKAPNSLAKAQETLVQTAALEAARRFGLPRNISPLDALAEELHRTQGHVDWLAEQVASHGDVNPAVLAVYQAERAHLMRITQQAISVGLDERRIKVSEMALEAMQTAILATLDDFGIETDQSYVREALARRLEQTLTRRAGRSKRDDVIGAHVIEPMTQTPLPAPVDF
jgi:hypothetical protein